MPLNVLLTGATGFIGAFLKQKLDGCLNIHTRIAVRSANDLSLPDSYLVGCLSQETDWSGILPGVDVVVHCAGLAHISDREAGDSLAAFYETNAKATEALAQQCARAGVQRFIFMSSIGVNGNASNQPLTAKDIPAPAEPYAISKFQAEKYLWCIQRKKLMETTVIRPTLVYGPNAPGKFGHLVKAVRSGIPLPLDGINNCRSFVSVWNLSDLIQTCIEHPDAGNSTFLVCDGEDISTSGLLRKIAIAQGVTPRLFWMPKRLLKAGAMLIGKRQMYDRLFDSLQVDDTATRETLNWTPPLSLDEGIRRSFSEN